MQTATKRSELIRREAKRLRDFIAVQSPENLALPSACDQWEVRDVLAHIIFALELWCDSISRGLKGDTSPNPAFTWPGSRFPTEENAADTIARRKELGDQLLPTFFRLLDQLDALLARVGPDQWDIPVWHRSDGIMPLHTFLNSMMRTFNIHGWDVRSGIDPDASLTTECVPDLVEHINRWLTLCFRPAQPLSRPLRFRFLLTGALTAIRDVVVYGDRFDIEEDGQAEPDVTVRCDAGAFVLVMYGRRSRDQALERGELTVADNLATLAEFDRWFRPV